MDDLQNTKPCPACQGPATVRRNRVTFAHVSWCPVPQRLARQRKVTKIIDQLDRIEQMLTALQQAGAAVTRAELAEVGA